jgi:DNA repair exonuclease SbcCD ATPase subunit
LVEIASLEQKRDLLKLQISDEAVKTEQEQAQQVRIQAQEEKVESITLPFDFDDIFENAKANEMIIEVVKEFQRKAYEDHNAEIQTLTEGHKEREANLKFQLEQSYKIVDNGKLEYAELQETYNKELCDRDDKISELNRELESIQESHFKLSEAIHDALSKRNAAAELLKEAQAEIAQLKSRNDDLRAQAAHGVRKAIDIIDISPSEKLALMVKETNEQKANRGLARWAEMMPEVVAPPVVPAGTAVFQPGDTQANDTAHQLDETGFIPIPADHQEVAAPVTFPVQSGDTMDNGVPVQDGATVTRQEFEALRATVRELCQVCDIAEVA